jgi:hypothetical protein
VAQETTDVNLVAIIEPADVMKLGKAEITIAVSKIYINYLKENLWSIMIISGKEWNITKKRIMTRLSIN